MSWKEKWIEIIIYHHGPWSKYKLHNFTKLSSLIHDADMRTSHNYKI